MKKLHTHLILILAWLVIITGVNQGCFLAGSSAQTNETALDLSITPPTTYFNIKPGETKQHTILIKNTGAADVLAQLSLSDFHGDNTTGFPTLAGGSTFSYLKIRDEKINWKTDFLLKQGAEKKIVFDLAIPETATDGEYPLTILVSGSKLGAQIAGQSPITGMIGTNLIVLIASSDQDQSNLNLESLTAPRIIDSLQNLQFMAKFNNTGKHAAPIQGRVTITNLFGSEVKRYLIYPDMVLANSSRQARFVDTTNTQITDVASLAEQTDILPTSQPTYTSLFLLGPYTVRIEHPQGTVAYTVIALPISLLLAALALPLFIITTIRFLRIISKRRV